MIDKRRILPASVALVALTLLTIASFKIHPVVGYIFTGLLLLWIAGSHVGAIEKEENEVLQLALKKIDELTKAKVPEGQRPPDSDLVLREASRFDRGAVPPGAVPSKPL